MWDSQAAVLGGYFHGEIRILEVRSLETHPLTSNRVTRVRGCPLILPSLTLLFNKQKRRKPPRGHGHAGVDCPRP